MYYDSNLVLWVRVRVRVRGGAKRWLLMGSGQGSGGDDHGVVVVSLVVVVIGFTVVVVAFVDVCCCCCGVLCLYASHHISDWRVALPRCYCFDCRLRL